MQNKHYVFLTIEGYTFQPTSEENEPDIENLQVIGFASGLNQEEAFERLIEKNDYLLHTSFNQVFCYKLDDYYKDSKKYFYISDFKDSVAAGIR